MKAQIPLNLIEKDILLHNILLTLSESDYYRSSSLFKGGTCLIKSYLGYFRFSEDLDFTWRDQSRFNNMSSKELRKLLSGEIDKIGLLLESTAKSLGLDFVCKKSDRRYVELGGSNKMATFKLWYDSVVLEHEAFLKIQINFVEKLLFPAADRTFKSLISNKVRTETASFFPEEFGSFGQEIIFPAYDIREILCEKVRSILTRKGIKARDFVDIFMISKKHNIVPDEFESQILEKTVFSLKLYEKYRENLKRKKEMLSSDDFFEWGAEREILLCEVSMVEFYAFVRKLLDLSQKITEEISIE